MAEALYVPTVYSIAKSYYRLEGNSTDSKSTNNGTDTAITYNTSSGKYGQGASLNGTTSLIQINAAAVAGGSTYSVAGWFNTSSTAEGTIYGEGNTATDNSLGDIRINYAGTNGQLAFEFRDDAGTLGSCAYSPGAGVLNNGSWHHFSALKKATNSWELYVDNVSRATSATTLGTTTINRVTIGALVRATTVLYYSGTTDDIVNSPSVFTASMISSLYTAKSSNLTLMGVG